MQFENRFAVAAPIGQVWDALMDIERVTPCLPGAQVLERSDEDFYAVGVRVKVGPMVMNYRGQVEITSRDPEARRATLRVQAREARGQGTAEADVTMALAEVDAATQAAIDTQIRLSGKAAAMGQGVIADVAGTLVDQFAGNLTQMLAEQPAGAQPAGARPDADGADAPSAGPSAPIAGADESLSLLPILARSLAVQVRRPPVLAAIAAVLGVLVLRRRMRRR